MNEMKFKYTPLSFKGEEGAENRVRRKDFTNKIELEGSLSFIKSKVITPFEKAFKGSKLETLTNGDLRITKNIKKGGKASTSWKTIYTKLVDFLEVRADDSRAASQKDVEKFSGIGYCIAVQALQDQVDKLTNDATSISSASTSIKWPGKKKSEEYPTPLLVPDRNYSKMTPENLTTVLQAKRFSSGATQAVLSTFTGELKRWFEANTGYHPPDEIPDKETGFVERTLELAEGSYIQIQLIRENDPDYKEIIGMTNAYLLDLSNGISIDKFKSTKKGKKPYINIKSLYDYLDLENLEKRRPSKARF